MKSADPGLNLSAYKNATADQLLEQARFGKDVAFRDAKYKEFVRIWAEDVPALLLYSPRYLYAHTVELTGLQAHNLVSPSDRFYNVQDWAIRQRIAPRKN